jgi:hypothetical protein
MSEAYEVIVKETGRAIGYACRKCKRLSVAFPGMDGKIDDSSVPHAKLEAERCCNRKCNECQAYMEFPNGYVVCADCRVTKEAARELEAYEKAEKIQEAEYVGWLYFNNEYLRDDEELEDHCVQNEVEWPAWVWACSKIEFKINAASIIENALQNHYEDASDHVKREDEEELQTLLDVWCAKVGKRWESREEDRSRVVVLEPMELSDD